MPSLSGLGRALLVGLAIREILAPWTGHPFDFEIWVRLGVFIQSGASPYSLLPYVPNLSFSPVPFLTSISYPPLPAFIFGATYSLYLSLGSQSPYLYYFLLKQPMVISDLLISVFLFKLVSLNGETDRARKVATIWIYLPFSIIISAIWGALDPMALLLILASIYTWETDKRYLSAGLLGLAIYLKLLPIIFLPLFLFQSSIPKRGKAVFAFISLFIPLVGTLVPFYLLGWNLSGVSSAISYQGTLPDFGGMGIFNGLSLIVPRGSELTQILGWAWVPALLAAYSYAYIKKIGLVTGLLITALAFGLFRSVLPEQWALYPIAFLLLMRNGENRARVLAVAAVATAFLLTNNALLVRFFSPVSIGALNWDLYVDNLSSFSEVRYALLFVLSTFFSAEALSIMFGKNPFLASKLEALKGISRKDLLPPLAYLLVISLTGGLLDFTATRMVTDWALAIQSKVFLGLSWLSLYHIMLVVVFETLVALVVIFSRRNLPESVGLLLRLTFLNFMASSTALIAYRILEGAPALSSTTIYLLSSSYVTERAFVVFGITLGALGLFYLNEMRSILLWVARAIVQISARSRREESFAHSLPTPP